MIARAADGDLPPSPERFGVIVCTVPAGQGLRMVVRAQLEEDDRMPTPHERADWKPKQLFPENLQRVWRRTVERLELAEPEAYVTGFEKGGER